MLWEARAAAKSKNEGLAPQRLALGGVLQMLSIDLGSVPQMRRDISKTK